MQSFYALHMRCKLGFTTVWMGVQVRCPSELPPGTQLLLRRTTNGANGAGAAGGAVR